MSYVTTVHWRTFQNIPLAFINKKLLNFLIWLYDSIFSIPTELELFKIILFSYSNNVQFYHFCWGNFYNIVSILPPPKFVGHSSLSYLFFFPLSFSSRNSTPVSFFSILSLPISYTFNNLFTNYFLWPFYLFHSHPAPHFKAPKYFRFNFLSVQVSEPYKAMLQT